MILQPVDGATDGATRRVIYPASCKNNSMEVVTVIAKQVNYR